MRPGGSIALLRRFAAEAPAVAPRCDACAAVLAPSHAHRLESASARLRCVCQACASTVGPWMTVARRVRVLREIDERVDVCETLGLPLRLAFFTRKGVDGSTVAYFPSPAGLTASAIDVEQWADLCAMIPAAAAMESDVEALLVNRVNGARDCFIVSIDVCYDIVGALRSRWRAARSDAALDVGPLVSELREQAEHA